MRRSDTAEAGAGRPETAKASAWRPGTAGTNARPLPTSPDPATFRKVLSNFCSGVVIVTTVDDQGPTGMTCQSFSSLSLDPPLVLLCPGKGSTTWPRIAATGVFCVNILAEHQQADCWRFASKGADKFDGTSWHATPGGSPVLDGVIGYVDCRVEAVHDGGDHHIVVGRVLDLAVTSTARPLLYFRNSHPRVEDPHAGHIPFLGAPDW
ncbi:flavin reductase family protein [Streptosporangium carneum]|uniref:flavin reductase family protein n=1 Tax=Streptosporangium carneum TaxID=47481 RepID=UPI0022F2EF4A|nr:flavin reductase family protein [Streptosporangium carneum]